MHQPFDISTVIFAVLAIFVVWKLRSVLGTRTGNERPPFDPFEARRKLREGKAARDASPAPDRPGTGTVVRMPGVEPRPAEAAPPQVDAAEAWKTFVEPGSTATDRLVTIAAADRTFTAESFMVGARAAYEMILLAFASGDQQVLKPLLAKDVFDGFAAAIAQREERGQKTETTFVSTEKSTVQDAQLKGRTAQVSINFHSKLITVTRDRTGAIVEGAPDQVGDVHDLWTFARDVDSRDPNWKLVATEAGA